MYVDMGEKTSLSRPKPGSTILWGKKKKQNKKTKKRGFFWEVTKGALGGDSPGAHFAGRH